MLNQKNVAKLITTLFLVGGSAFAFAVTPDIPAAAAPGVTEMEVHEVAEVAEVPEVPDVAEAPEAIEVAEVPEAPETH